MWWHTKEFSVTNKLKWAFMMALTARARGCIPHRISLENIDKALKAYLVRLKGGEFTSFTIKLRANELETRATDAERVLQHEWCSWSLARSAQRYASNNENSLRQAPFLTSPTWISRLIPALQKPFHWLAKANVISRNISRLLRIRKILRLLPFHSMYIAYAYEKS